jgi:hypothetical protein
MLTDVWDGDNKMMGVAEIIFLHITVNHAAFLSTMHLQSIQFTMLQYQSSTQLQRFNDGRMESVSLTGKH